MRSTELTPLLFWAGGKRWAARIVRSLMAETGAVRLVEPFCGGLGVPLMLRPEQALLTDLNPHVINLYQYVQQGLHRELDMQIDRGMYYTRRNEFNDLIRNGWGDTPRAAEVFYYLNQTGFHGICRFNRSGEYNVAFGTGKGTHYVESFEPYRIAFREWEFDACDYSQTVARIGAGDFLFCDPPYDASFDDYTEVPFGWKQQCALVERLRTVKVPIMLANRPTDRILGLYAEYGYHVRLVDRTHRVSSAGVSGHAAEVLAFRNIPEEALRPELFASRTKASPSLRGKAGAA